MSVGCDTAYPGVSARRRLTLRDGALVDELTVETDRPRRIAVQLRPDVDLTVRAGAGGSLETVWPGRQTYVASTPPRPRGGDVPAGPGPADDPQRVRTWVDWTAVDATTVTFRSIYRLEN